VPGDAQGVDRGKQYCGGKRRQSRNLPLSQSAASSTGQSGRTIQRLVRIGKLLTPETK
jgi:hypothetical protein